MEAQLSFGQDSVYAGTSHIDTGSHAENLKGIRKKKLNTIVRVSL